MQGGEGVGRKEGKGSSESSDIHAHSHILSISPSHPSPSSSFQAPTLINEDDDSAEDSNKDEEHMYDVNVVPPLDEWIDLKVRVCVSLVRNTSGDQYNRSMGVALNI
jgi:hypothetical protein